MKNIFVSSTVGLFFSILIPYSALLYQLATCHDRDASCGWMMLAIFALFIVATPIVFLHFLSTFWILHRYSKITSPRFILISGVLALIFGLPAVSNRELFNTYSVIFSFVGFPYTPHTETLSKSQLSTMVFIYTMMVWGFLSFGSKIAVNFYNRRLIKTNS